MHHFNLLISVWYIASLPSWEIDVCIMGILLFSFDFGVTVGTTFFSVRHTIRFIYVIGLCIIYTALERRVTGLKCIYSYFVKAIKITKSFDLAPDKSKVFPLQLG